MNFDTNTLDLLDTLKVPETTEETITINKDDIVNPIALTTKVEIVIDKEHRQLLYDNFTDEQKELFNTTTEKNVKYPHAFNNVEYYTAIDKFYFSREAIIYMKNNPAVNIILCAYGLENSTDKTPDYLKQFKLTTELKYDTFPVYDSVAIHKFNDTSYICDNEKNYAVLFINLPYEYYKDIYLPEKLYYYDKELNRNIFCFCDTTTDDVKELFDTEAKEIKPLPMKIKNGTIVATEYAMPLLFAKRFKLPYIPAIVISDTSSYDYEKLTPEVTDKELANKVFNPYFLCV